MCFFVFVFYTGFGVYFYFVPLLELKVGLGERSANASILMHCLLAVSHTILPSSRVLVMHETYVNVHACVFAGGTNGAAIKTTTSCGQ